MIDPFARTQERLAIVGFCMPHRDWVPYEETDLEIWQLNRAAIFAQPMPHRPVGADRWFEMHGEHIYTWEQRRPGNHLRFLMDFPGPVYMHQAQPDVIPNSVTYPLKAIADDIGEHIWRFGPAHDHPTRGLAERVHGTEVPYLSSSIAQQIAFAIHLGYQQIGLYGIDLNTSSEYAWQKPGVEHMLGLAAGRGIDILIPDVCPLLADAIYGRGYMSPEGEHVGPEQWTERIKALTDKKEDLERKINETAGGHRELKYLLEQMIPGLKHEVMDQRRQKMEAAINQLRSDLLQCVGSLQETLYWAHQTPHGQDPAEAINQLRSSADIDAAQMDGEGPRGLEETLRDTPDNIPASGVLVAV